MLSAMHTCCEVCLPCQRGMRIPVRRVVCDLHVDFKLVEVTSADHAENGRDPSFDAGLWFDDEGWSYLRVYHSRCQGCRSASRDQQLALKKCFVSMCTG